MRSNMALRLEHELAYMKTTLGNVRDGGEGGW